MIILALIGTGACGDGSVTQTEIPVVRGREPPRSGLVFSPEPDAGPPSSPIPDGSAGDVPSSPVLDAGALPGLGELCPTWECAEGAICFMGVCRKQCTQALPNCNDTVAACDPGDACIPGASSFTDVCYPAEAKLDEPCGPVNGKQCLPGYLCVTVDNEPARCLRLCKYGCPTNQTTQCEQTGNGCPVCIPYP